MALNLENNGNAKISQLPAAAYPIDQYDCIPMAQWDNVNLVYNTVATTPRDLIGAVNVRWFGAVGNGVTNDSAAIQAALTFAADNNRAVFFPAGSYRLTYLVAATNNHGISMYGEGPNVSRIIYDGSTAGIVLSATSTNSSYSWSGLRM